MATLLTSQKQILEDMRKLDLEVLVHQLGARLANLRVQPTLIDRIKVNQNEDPHVQKIKEGMEAGGQADFSTHEDSSLRSPIYWDDVGEKRLTGLEFIQQSEEKVRLIRECLKTAQSRQKSYADLKRRKVEFSVGDHVFLKVSPTKGVMRFDMRGKLSPRYVGPFLILEKIGEVAYKLALPPALSGVHNVLYVSLLRKYVPNPEHVLDFTPLRLRENLTYEDQPIRIVDRKDRVLRRWTIPYVKIQWRNHTEREATWELEEEAKRKYPHLFDG
ncbi:uncharacterized protein LOC130134750 [Syzygium oleosum]|uniref:uncharacterized protein LOC130134750 n=1 Tax=Syzygium oleosum TaxID=219896 RepID=UPI0024B9BEC9|nr:uncharacterized protein LOC130134750 [Syzygium oleosum]